WLPFEQVPEALAWFTRVVVSPETARRVTEAAGAALVAVETAAVEQLEQQWPEPPGVPATRQQVSVDGAMVPLVHGEWAEVKTVAVGRVERRGETLHATDLSYFSRLADVDTVTRLAWGELHRRGPACRRAVGARGGGAARVR